MSRIKSFWKTFPRRSFFFFLLGVFFIFSTVAFVNDIGELGREPTLRMALSILLYGTFPVLYAATGFVLRKDFWKAFVPLFVVHFFLMNVLVRLFPAPPQLAEMSATDIARLHDRVSADGLAILVAVAVGYV